ncbi:MAG TPA: YhbD family protein [Methanocella sp.]|nr:YhbD family protein [Methanocella sp.]
MEEELISKKELLDITGISYGALYRWKRKNLIPEEWFIRKSTFTGQETFFPRDKILARIEKIKNMKEDLSLDDLADVLSPTPTSVTMSKEELIKRNIVTPAALELCLQQYGSMDIFKFEKILFLYVLDKALQSGDVSIEEGKLLLGTLTENYEKYGGKKCELVFLRKMGVSTCFLHGSPCEFYFETGARIVLRIDMGERIEELKIRIG